MTIEIYEVEWSGHPMWRFHCDQCGRTSAMFSTRDLTEEEAGIVKNKKPGAKSHVRYRCVPEGS